MHGRVHKNGNNHLGDRTMPISGRANPENEENIKARSASFDSSFTDENNKLPMIRMRKVMKKIGAADKNLSVYVPSDEDQTAFRKSKWLELRQHYSTRKNKQQPFDYELD